MTAARAFRDTVPMGLMQGLPPLQAVPVVDDVLSTEDGIDAAPGPAAPSRREKRRARGALLMPDLARALMGVAAAAAAAVTVLLLVLGASADSAAAGLLSVPWALLVVAAAAFMRVPQRLQWRAVTGATVFMALLVAVSAWALNLGLASPTLSVLGLLVCAACAMAGWHSGLCVAAASLLGITGVAVLSWPDAAAQTGLPALPGLPIGAPGLNLPVMELVTHLIVLGVGLACGTLLARTMSRTLRAGQEREQRFSRLLALAASAYWELDQDYRLVSVTLQNAARTQLTLRDGLGSVPWELTHFACDPATLDDLLADLDARQPFRERNVSWTTPRGDQRRLLVSGEPRFDARGVFTGYWGVSRDVTEMVVAREALMATETRYQDLFSRIPTPLVMHRDHIVVDANPAAAQLFGHDEPGTLIGTDLLGHFESAEARDRARERAEQLLHAPLGAALPVTDYKLRVNGRQLAVRTTGVRVQADSGPAMLAIFVDDTERLATEDAVRRSEAMLSHLVATSPDLIMLTDAASGRFAMVNQSFERVTGYTQTEAVGLTPQELGLWADDQQRVRLQARVMATGSVSDLPLNVTAKDGRLLPMRVSAARFAMDRRDYIVLNARDISESERARMERETILTHASIGIAVSRQQRFVLANPHFERIFGWEPGGLTGQRVGVLWPSKQAYVDMTRSHGAALEKGQPVSFETTVRRHDGSTFEAHVRLRAIDPEHAEEGGEAWIVEDVTDRRDAEKALARARDDAEAANRAKSAFLANTSHELRTPLNGLIGLTRLARDAETSEVQRREYLEQIGESAQSLAGIITDILDVSKIEAGKLLLETAVFDLGKLLLALQTTYTPLALSSNLSLHFDIDPAVMGCVSGDPLRVRQIISNFLTNALKFTAQGQVRVAVRRKAGAEGEASHLVRVEVHDTGPGIAHAAQAQLFKPFTQADQSTTRRFGGTGLGLSINRELATLMGGEVGVISDEGQGCTFWADLPLPAARAARVPAPRTGNDSLQDMRVLMVEDNPVNMLIAVAMLQRWGVQVTQAHNGLEAVQAVKAAAQAGEPFDAVLMDVQMPVMSGHEATRELRKSEQGHHLPIIALTAAALVTEREEAMRAGMNDFLTKPIDSEKLRAALQRSFAAAH